MIDWLLAELPLCGILIGVIRGSGGAGRLRSMHVREASLPALLQALLDDSAGFLQAETRQVAATVAGGSLIQLGAGLFGGDFFARRCEALQ